MAHKFLEVEVRLSFYRWLDQRSYTIKSLCHQIKFNRNVTISCIKITDRRVFEVDFRWIYFKSQGDSKINSTKTKFNMKIYGVDWGWGFLFIPRKDMLSLISFVLKWIISDDSSRDSNWYQMNFSLEIKSFCFISK